MTPTFSYPGKPCRGDAVAVLSPSAEYPTTRAAQAPPAARAGDIHAAFADPDIKAVIASIGGEDELKVLAHLDPGVLAASPKPFFGYSDNTNLHLFLWNLGRVSCGTPASSTKPCSPRSPSTTQASRWCSARTSGTPNRSTSSPAAERSPSTAGPGRSR